jgi:2-dehydro-3-deoxygluconokinase
MSTKLTKEREGDVAGIGETMVCFLAESYGSLRYKPRFEKYIGGTESNTLIALAKFGFSVGWISRLGSDEFGHNIRDFIRGHGVDVSRVSFDDKSPTGVFFVEKNANDETRSYYYRAGSAASRMDIAHIDLDYFSSYGLIHTNGITPILSTNCRELIAKLFRAAKAQGMKISFDPNLRLRMAAIERFREVLLPLIPLVDIFLPNERELLLLMDTQNLDDAIDRVLGMGVGKIAIKRGMNGELFAGNGVRRTGPPFPVKQVVSSMAAGDAFNAGYLAGFLRGFSDFDSLKLANCLGAMATLAWGPYESIPCWEDVMAYLEGKGVLER